LRPTRIAAGWVIARRHPDAGQSDGEGIGGANVKPTDLVIESDDLIADLIEFLLNDDPGIDDSDADGEAPGNDQGGEQ
jgi:hypothetical protein